MIAKNNEIGLLWNNLYIKQKSKGRFTWNREPSNFIIESIPNFIKEKYENVLDLGCGDGRNSIPFLENGFSVTGVDVSFIALDLAKKNFIKKGYKKFRLLQMNLKDLKLNHKYDIIISTKVFKHTWETEDIIKKTFNYLKDDGNVMLEFPSTTDSSYFKCLLYGKKFRKHRFVYKNSLKYRFYEKKELENIFKNLSDINIKQEEYWDEPHAELSTKPHKHKSWLVIGNKSV